MRKSDAMVVIPEGERNLNLLVGGSMDGGRSKVCRPGNPYC